MYTQQGSDAIHILVLKVNAVPADNRVVDTGFLDFKSSGIDQKVQLELLTFEDWALWADFGDSFTMGVYQMNIVFVE